MDPLFQKLFSEITNFIVLAKKAPEKLSEIGYQDEREGNFNRYFGFWRELVERTEKASQKLQLVLDQQQINHTALDHALTYFRQLPRYAGEGPCVWSAYYPELNKIMGDIHCSLIDIDTKYHLGQHRFDLT